MLDDVKLIAPSGLVELSHGPLRKRDAALTAILKDPRNNSFLSHKNLAAASDSDGNSSDLVDEATYTFDGRADWRWESDEGWECDG